MKTRYQALDSWRGIAAILVMLYHGSFVGPFSTQGAGRGGYLWVDFFFVLSGFVIAHAYGDRISSGREAASFLIRRFGRLWPLHFAMMLIFLAAEGFAMAARAHAGEGGVFAPSANDNTSATFALNLVLLNAMGLTKGLAWNGPSWSIGAEFWCYAFFCWVVLFTRGAGRIAACAVLATASAMFVVLFSPHMPPMNTTYDFGFPRAMYGFFVGVLVHACATLAGGDLRGGQTLIRPLATFSRKREKGFILRGATVLELVVTAGAALFVALGSDGVLSVDSPLVFAPLILVFSYQAGALSRLLEARIFVKLGTWSYSIYMIHPLVNNAWTRAIKAGVAKLHLAPLIPIENPDHMMFAAGSTSEYWLIQASEALLLIGVIALASLTYACIERPARSAFNALADRVANGQRSRTLRAFG